MSEPKLFLFFSAASSIASSGDSSPDNNYLRVTGAIGDGALSIVAHVSVNRASFSKLLQGYPAPRSKHPVDIDVKSAF